MSEIEKMYKNSGIKKIELDYPDNFEPFYPEFTAEKQIELIKLIANSKGYPDYEYFGKLFDDYIQLLGFNEALARLVNSLWQDLTKEEKQQVKEILE